MITLKLKYVLFVSFYRAESVQSGLSHEQNVHLSVYLSLKCVKCEKKEMYANIFIPC